MVSLPRTGLAVASLLAVLLAVPPAAADTGFLVLGVDATGDPELNGVPMVDTWIDINGLSVATIGTDLVFHLGLEGVTTEAGTYCWMAGFTFGGDKYVGLDCYEGAAYESDNTLSGVSPPSTSRGTNVASSVVFDDTGAVITIPLASIKANVGDSIDDIYGLTYATRGLIAVDTVPDARMSSSATESLGSYRIGGPIDGGATATLYGNLTNGSFRHEFTNLTTATYVLNMTIPWQQATVRVDAVVHNGSANVTFLQDGTSRLSFLVTNATNPAGNVTGNGTAIGSAPYSLANATGNWSIEVRYDGFVGHLGINVTQAVPTFAPTDSTSGSPSVAPASDEKAEAEAPAPGLALLALALVAVAFVRRRKA